MIHPRASAATMRTHPRQIVAHHSRHGAAQSARLSMNRRILARVASRRIRATDHQPMSGIARMQVCPAHDLKKNMLPGLDLGLATGFCDRQM
jgi:hypothetical protein